jgi:hypothetical protein
MKPEERASHSVSSEWGEGTSWVLQMSDQQDQTSSEANMEAEQREVNESRNEQGVQMDGQAAQGIRARDVFPADQAALWEELYDWCLRVRRDILCLEAWALGHGHDHSKEYRPCGKPDSDRDTTERMIRALEQIVNGDPGDPPGGPFA